MILTEQYTTIASSSLLALTSVRLQRLGSTVGNILELPQARFYVPECSGKFWWKGLWIGRPVMCLLMFQIPLDRRRASSMSGGEQATLGNRESRSNSSICWPIYLVELLFFK